jgi:hypothetical protein
VEAAERAGDATRGYFGALIAERRARPSDDLLGHLVAVRDGVEGLSEDELMGTITLIFVAGFITTSTLIGNGLLAFARHPGEMDRLPLRSSPPARCDRGHDGGNQAVGVPPTTPDHEWVGKPCSSPAVQQGIAVRPEEATTGAGELLTIQASPW